MGETFNQVMYNLKSAGVTSLSKAQSGTIVIGAGKSGRLRRILLTALGTSETVVCAGGLVEITNDSISNMLFKAVVGGVTAVTEGGGMQNEPQVYLVDYPIVESTFTINYTPYDDQDQTLEVELEWEKDGKPDISRPNHVDAELVLKASAITQVTVDEAHNSIKIPLGRGGTLLSCEIMVFPTLETVVNAGGKVVLKSTVDSYKPCEFIVGGFTSVGASGGGQIKPNQREIMKPLSGNTTITTDYTPYDNQSQSLGLTLLWRGAEPR